VASKVAGAEVCLRRSDLDYVGMHNEWRLQKDARAGYKQRFNQLNVLDHGSVVLLENLDRLSRQQNAKDESKRRKISLA
jgi:hypothetical protein